MSNSNLIDLREWRQPRFEPGKQNVASSQETPLLLRAFCAIESPLARSDIIRLAQKAAFPGGQPPPENVS